MSPVLLTQAMQVIYRTPRLPEASGPRQGRSGSGPVLKVLILGDSSAAGVGVKHQSQALSGQLTRNLGAAFSVEWRLVAQTGLTTKNTPKFLNARLYGKFDICVTALGVNDATRLVSPTKWISQTMALHDLLTCNHRIKRIYVTAMPPLARFAALPNPLARVLGDHATLMSDALESRLLGDEIRQIVTPNWGHDPAMMALDGFHPGAATYAQWGDHMARHIIDDLETNPI
ncbi:SGNH/GDSL hydrolase family protein [Roseobacter sp.]|uniref:SGNH/GDSL hydrolase family protein n=1 Tax=Roseobacter sp. TaxID=1907202 RepID=UPI00385AF49D